MSARDRKSTRLNSSHTEIYTLSLHDALPIFAQRHGHRLEDVARFEDLHAGEEVVGDAAERIDVRARSEEHTSELQSHRDLHSFPTRRSSDLRAASWPPPGRRCSIRRPARR